MTTSLSQLPTKSFIAVINQQSEIVDEALSSNKQIQETLLNATKDFKDATRALKASYERELSKRNTTIKYLTIGVVGLMTVSVILSLKIIMNKC